MSFTTINVKDEINKRIQENTEFRKKWENSREEYRLIGEMIKLRKQEKITQSKLANLTGTKQQVISRIEKNEQNTSLKLFCRMLDVLGYELKIVKKNKKAL